jgi:hypothetical protein
MEIAMTDRHLIGDVALAVLLALPSIALARPAPAMPADKSVAVSLPEKAIIAERTRTPERRLGLG